MTDDTLAAVARLLAAGDALDDLTGAELARCATDAARDAQTVASAVAVYRDRAIGAMLLAGMSRTAVADALGISKQRVSQLVAKGWRTSGYPRRATTAPPTKGVADVEITTDYGQLTCAPSQTHWLAH